MQSLLGCLVIMFLVLIISGFRFFAQTASGRFDMKSKDVHLAFSLTWGHLICLPKNS